MPKISKPKVTVGLAVTFGTTAVMMLVGFTGIASGWVSGLLVRALARAFGANVQAAPVNALG